jgi:hypothetical protein
VAASNSSPQKIAADAEWEAVRHQLGRIEILKKTEARIFLNILQKISTIHALHAQSESSWPEGVESAKNYENEVKASLDAASKFLEILNNSSISSIIPDIEAQHLRDNLKFFITHTEAFIPRIRIKPQGRGATTKYSTYRLALSFEYLWRHFVGDMSAHAYEVAEEFFFVANCKPQGRLSNGRQQNIERIFRTARKLKAEADHHIAAMLEPYLLIARQLNKP